MKPVKALAVAALFLVTINVILPQATAADRTRAGKYKPKPLPDTSRTHDYIGESREWFKKTYPENYEKYGVHSDEWDDRARELLKQYAVFKIGLLSNAEKQALADDLLSLVNSGCNDPGMMYVCADTLFRVGRTKEAAPWAEKSLAALEKSKYPRIYLYYAVRIVKILSGGQDLQLSKKVVRYCIQGIEDEMFQDVETLADRHYVGEFFEVWRSFKGRSQLKKLFLSEFKKAKCSPWQRSYYTGRMEMEEAREMMEKQGKKPTSMERARLKRKISDARRKLEQAHRLNPDRWEPAEAILEMCLWSGEGNPREWFDKAVAGGWGWTSIAETMLESLHPRNGGSHEAMLRFAREMVDQGDTKGLLMYGGLEVIAQIAGELDNWQDAYKMDGVREMAVSYGELHLHLGDPAKSHLTSLAITVLWTGGYLEDAAILFEKINRNFLNERVHVVYRSPDPAVVKKDILDYINSRKP